MEQNTQTFAALYDALPPTEKNRITAEIVNHCIRVFVFLTVKLGLHTGTDFRVFELQAGRKLYGQ